MSLPASVGLLGIDVPFTPESSALPGGNVLQSLTNGIGGWALTLSLVGLLVGAAAWALGSHTQNYQQTFVGRRAVLISGLAALLIGAAPTLIGSFFDLGHGATPTQPPAQSPATTTAPAPPAAGATTAYLTADQ